MTTDVMIELSAVTLDCPDATALAGFYAEITGGRVAAVANNAWATVQGPGGRIDFQTVPHYTPPTWPEPSSIMMHLDFLVTDRAGAEARVLAAGATRYDVQPNPEQCTVYADPVGHPFCLTTWPGLTP